MEADRDVTYRAMHLIAEYLLKSGHPVILDATYTRPVHTMALRDLAGASGVALRIIQCRVSADLAVRRFKERSPGHFAVDLTEQRVRDFANAYPYRDDVLTVSIDGAIEPWMDRIVSYV